MPKRTAFVAGAQVHLTSREFSLLVFLVLHAGGAVSRADLLDKVLGLRFDPGTNVLDVNVSRLRRKLETSGATVSIASHRGTGFVLTVPAEEGRPR